MAANERKLSFREKKMIQLFDELAAGYIEYGKAPANTKKVETSWAKNPAARYTNRPQNHDGNFIGIPINRLVVFDIDDNGKSLHSVHEQISILGEYLDGTKPLETTSLIVRSASGGAHIYTLWHPETPLPASGNDVLKLIDSRLSGDIKSSKKNSYVMIPGSFREIEGMGEMPYELWMGFEPQRLSKGACDEIFEAREGVAPDAVTVDASTGKHVYNVNKKKTGVESSVLNRLRRGLKTLEAPEYHRKRAWVKRSLSCHYSDVDIANMCSTLKIDYDSNSGNPLRLEYAELVKDVARISADAECSYICGKGMPAQRKEHYDEYMTVEDASAIARVKERQFSKYRRFTVLDRLWVAKALVGTVNRKPGKSKQLAWRIASEVVSENLLLGRTNIILSIGYLSERYDVTRNQIDRALRVLRETNIITIHRKQFEGSPTIYQVNSAFIEDGVTTVLNATIKDAVGDGDWFEAQAGIDWHSGTVSALEPHTGALSTIVSTKQEKREAQLQELFSGKLF